MRKPFLALFAASAVFGAALAAQTTPKISPTVDQILSLKRAGSPEISPDGRLVAYTVRETNWDDNAYETEIWLADPRAGTTRQLTNAKKSSQSPAWSPDGSKLAFTSDRTDKPQIYLINPQAGEAEALTTLEDGVSRFAWSPDGTRIAYTATDPKSDAIKDREKKYGEFQVVDQDHRMTQLFVLDVATKKTRPLASGAFTVGSFAWSPDGTRIAFDHRINSDPANGGSADISIVRVDDNSIRKLVTQDGPDSNPVWSPDGSRIAFTTAMANPNFFYTNSVIATVPASGGSPVTLTSAFDEDPNVVAWKPTGLFFSASQKTWSYLYRLDPETKAIARLASGDTPSAASGFSFSKDGSTVAFLGADATSMAEVFVTPVNFSTPRKLTALNAQTATWTTSALEVVSWKSQDGTNVEGVLHKPIDFNASRKYPLLVVIHGGPTGVSRAVPFTSTIYPIDVWVPRGVLVLEPNYRGSAGYGEKFRSLNVRNLGVGDAWDVIAGIDSLIAKGIVDPAKVGAMGWSQGGYISAFLATHDAPRFKAISVGAGISDWMTYYVNTDIHPFTRQYLKATPWDDPEIYAKTSPITYIKQAKTPTLIQHGAADQRVPLPNAFELYQGLQDQKVPVKLIVYQGFGGIGHGPSKPKSHRATMDHNLEWFDQYLFQTAPRATSQP
ncbi:MAG TPA: S9 family peptidase [Vicinamibacterales bacterium]|jgi:dipeptidyl aminopeptidase/acylaminoacyl peptidase|nr:S9 family peptidase [Vicinamibacterales bacterium]